VIVEAAVRRKEEVISGSAFPCISTMSTATRFWTQNEDNRFIFGI
jgi:hypothetical protein